MFYISDPGAQLCLYINYQAANVPDLHSEGGSPSLNHVFHTSIWIPWERKDKFEPIAHMDAQTHKITKMLPSHGIILCLLLYISSVYFVLPT